MSCKNYTNGVDWKWFQLNHNLPRKGCSRQAYPKWNPEEGNRAHSEHWFQPLLLGHELWCCHLNKKHLTSYLGIWNIHNIHWCYQQNCHIHKLVCWSGKERNDDEIFSPHFCKSILTHDDGDNLIFLSQLIPDTDIHPSALTNIVSACSVQMILDCSLRLVTLYDNQVDHTTHKSCLCWMMNCGNELSAGGFSCYIIIITVFWKAQSWI